MSEQGMPPPAPRPRWSMVVSHHPPTQYDRTFHLGPIRLCVRCSAVVGGFAASLVAGHCHPAMRDWAPWIVLVIAGLTIAVGVLLFVLNEGGRRASSNLERTVFGLVVGAALAWCWQSSIPGLIAMVSMLVVGQFVSAWGLQRVGALDRFFGEYMAGAVIPPEGADAVSCQRFLCACDGAVRLPR